MVTLHALGALDLRRDGVRCSALLAQPRRMALLVSIAARTGRLTHSRDELLAVFWPDLALPRARRALNQALYLLRHELGAEVIVSEGGEVRVEPSQLLYDVVAFEEYGRTGALLQAMSLYRGDFLPGFFVSGAPEFERWQEERRAQLRRSAAETAARLSNTARTHGKIDEAILWGRRELETAPHDESALRRLIALLAECGKRAEAMQTYTDFVRKLAADLELTPSVETLHLAQVLRQNTTDLPPEPRPMAAQAVVSESSSRVSPPQPPRRRPSAFARRWSVLALAAAAGSVAVLLGHERTESISPERRAQAERYTRLGRRSWDTRTPDGLSAATTHFRRALAEDSTYAPAMSGLADAYALMRWYGGMDKRASVAHARDAAMSAVRLDDGSAAAHASLGAVRAWFDDDWPRAEREFRRAIQLDPNYATAHEWLGLGLAVHQSISAARAELEIARRCDPVSAAIRTDLGTVLFWAHEYGAAVMELQAALTLDPKYARADAQLWRALAASGRGAEAYQSVVRATRLQGATSIQLNQMAAAYKTDGLRGALRTRAEILPALDLTAFDRPMVLATTYGMLGRNEEAMSWLRTARAEHSAAMQFATLDPAFYGLHGDARFERLVGEF
jgi:DNA-binding SARP family transcriptional activator/Tfp pilus assembly protein PilF